MQDSLAATTNGTMLKTTSLVDAHASAQSQLKLDLQALSAQLAEEKAESCQRAAEQAQEIQRLRSLSAGFESRVEHLESHASLQAANGKVTNGARDSHIKNDAEVEQLRIVLGGLEKQSAEQQMTIKTLEQQTSEGGSQGTARGV
jgi:hypothetical protein